MRAHRFTLAHLRRHARSRPPGYLNELRAVALDATGDEWVFDLDSPAYVALRQKYSAEDPRVASALLRPTEAIPEGFDPRAESGGCGCSPPPTAGP